MDGVMFYDLNEIQLMRAAIDVITIKGSDAKFVANLQRKLEEDIQMQSTPPPKRKSTTKGTASK